MNDVLQSVYERAPVFAQNMMLTAYSYMLDRQRYGGAFDSYYSFLTESQSFSRQELREYQNKKLRDLVNHAYDTVPYYRDLFDAIKLKPDDIKTLKDNIPRKHKKC